MLLEFLLSTVLQGYVDNSLGCVGITLKANTQIVRKAKSPASEVGIVPKDEITSITDESGALESLEGPVGETIVIRVKRRECMFTFKPWGTCPYCSGSNDIDVVKVFVVKRIPCGN